MTQAPVGRQLTCAAFLQPVLLVAATRNRASPRRPPAGTPMSTGPPHHRSQARGEMRSR